MRGKHPLGVMAGAIRSLYAGFNTKPNIYPNHNSNPNHPNPNSVTCRFQHELCPQGPLHGLHVLFQRHQQQGIQGPRGVERGSLALTLALTLTLTLTITFKVLEEWSGKALTQDARSLMSAGLVGVQISLLLSPLELVRIQGQNQSKGGLVEASDYS